MDKNEELQTLLINTLETLNKRIERLEEQLKKTSEMHTKNVATIQELNTTILSTNKIFDQVSTGIKDLYEKVKTLELWSKLLGNLGNLGPLLGGLGGLGQKK